LTGNIAVKNGIAQTNDLQAQLDIGNLGLVGTASLISEALNMRATAVISQHIFQAEVRARRPAIGPNEGERIDAQHQ
jgi:hypothetical protein